MTDEIHLDVQLTGRQYTLLRTALGWCLDWHHSEGRSALAGEYRTLLQRLDDGKIGAEQDAQ